LSNDSFDMRGSLTELELRSGVYEIMFSTCDDGPEDDFDKASLALKPARNHAKEGDEARGDRLKNGAKLIAGLADTMQIRRRLTYKLLLENSDAAMERYLWKEGVPASYRSLVISDDCIGTLVRGMFYKVCRMRRSAELDQEIIALCDSVRKNPQHLIAYDRVGLIQRFVHGKVDAKFGEGAKSRLPIKHMRNLLSVARLHLSLHDLHSMDEDHILHLDELSTARAHVEYVSPKVPELPSGKSFFPRWRVRHFRPLSYFYEKSLRQKVIDLRGIDLCMDCRIYADMALNIYAAKLD